MTDGNRPGRPGVSPGPRPALRPRPHSSHRVHTGAPGTQIQGPNTPQHAPRPTPRSGPCPLPPPLSRAAFNRGRRPAGGAGEARGARRLAARGRRLTRLRVPRRLALKPQHSPRRTRIGLRRLRRCPAAPGRGHSSTFPARAVYSRVRPAPSSTKMAAGAGPVARGSKTGLAGEARANPTRGGAPKSSIASLPRLLPRPAPPVTLWGAVGGRLGPNLTFWRLDIQNVSGSPKFTKLNLVDLQTASPLFVKVLATNHLTTGVNCTVIFKSSV